MLPRGRAQRGPTCLGPLGPGPLLLAGQEDAGTVQQLAVPRADQRVQAPAVAIAQGAETAPVHGAPQHMGTVLHDRGNVSLAA